MVPKKERRGIIGPWVFQRLSTTFSFLILMLENSVFFGQKSIQTMLKYCNMKKRLDLCMSASCS